MCFALFIGTIKPLPRVPWSKDAPDVHVEGLTDHNVMVKVHLCSPEVQYVGSSEGCGCSFRYWSEETGESSEDRSEQIAYNAETRRNRESLIRILQNSGEQAVNLYGVWEGDFDKAPESRHNVGLNDLLTAELEERGCYHVKIS